VENSIATFLMEKINNIPRKKDHDKRAKQIDTFVNELEENQ